MSISWKPWASPGAPSPADAHDAHACCAHHEVTAAGRSSIVEFAGAAPRRPKTCPNATRNACAFRSHSPANFEFPHPCQRPRRGAHHEHQRDPATRRRRQWRVFHKGLRLYGFASCAARFNGCRQCRRPRRAVGNELKYFTTTGISQASPNSPKVCRWGFWRGWRGWACIGNELNHSTRTRISQASPKPPKVCQWGFWRGWEGLGMHRERIKLLYYC